MKNSLFPAVLTLLILFSTFGASPAQINRNARTPQREPDPLPDWVTIPVKQTIYPPNARPQEFDSTLSWPTDLRPVTPPPPASTNDQVIVLPDCNFKTKNAKIIMGPPESGLVVVAGGVDTFHSPNVKALSFLFLVSLKHGKTISKTFPTEMKAFDISPNGKFLAVTIKPELPRPKQSKMNHLLVLRLDDGSFDPIAHYTPFDDAPSVRQRNDSMGIKDVLWLNNKQLFIVSESEMGAQFDLTTHTIGFGMYPEKECFASPYSLTPDRKYIIALHHAWYVNGNTAGVKGMAIFDAEEGKQLGYRSLTQNEPDKPSFAALHKIMDFSSNGRLMVSRGESDHLYVWDFSRGQVIGNYSQSVGEQGVWVKDRYIFGPDFGTHYLWDAREKDICAKYDKTTEMIDFVAVEDKLLYLASDDFFHPKEHRLICSSVIPTNMEVFIQEAARRKEKVMGPGDSVSLEFNLRHGSGCRSQIEQYLRKVCRDNGWRIDAPGDAEFRIEAYMTDLEDEIECRLAGRNQLPFEAPLATMKVRPFSIGYSVYQGNRLIWHRSSHIFPLRMYESVEEFNRLLPDEMRAKPDWFLACSFPETIVRGDMESEKRNATITFNGIEFK